MQSRTILVVDDDKNICELLDLYLTDAGFKAAFCHDGSSALTYVKESTPDLVLLDIMLPIISGWEVCKLIKMNSSVPVIMLTARDMLEDKLQGFDSGADDYVVKPFQPKELISRINARLRERQTKEPVIPIQQAKSADDVLRAGSLAIDINRYEVRLRDTLIDLKPKEVKLLHFMMFNKNIVFSRDQLLEKVWNYEFTGDTRTVDVHIKSLREKLGDGDEGWEIKTIWGVGYKFEAK